MSRFQTWRRKGDIGVRHIPMVSTLLAILSVPSCLRGTNRDPHQHSGFYADSTQSVQPVSIPSPSHGAVLREHDTHSPSKMCLESPSVEISMLCSNENFHSDLGR